MPTISIRRLEGPDDVAKGLLDEIEALNDKIRSKAHDLWQARSPGGGCSMDDWLRAEREVCCVPPAEMQETDRAVHLMIGVGGVTDDAIEVTLSKEIIILRGITTARQSIEPANDSRSLVLLRRFDLPAQVHAGSAVISLENDLLQVSAAKTGPA